MRIQDFLQEVVSHIRSKEARAFVRLELENHLEHSVQELKSQGKSTDEAEVLAVERMGAPDLLGKRMNKLHKPKIDWFLLIGFLILLGSSFLPFFYMEATFGEDLILKKLIYTIFGVVVALSCMFIDYRNFLTYGYLFYMMAVLLLLLINFSPHVIIGRPYLYLAGFSIEATYTLPLFLIAWASILSRTHSWLKVSTEKRTWLKIQPVWQLIIYYVLSLLLLLPTADLFLVFLYTALVLVMVLGSRVKKREKIVFTAAATIATLFAFIRGSHYWIERWKAFFHSAEYAESSGYLMMKAKEYMGEAGWFGQSYPQGGLLPEAHTDLIFVTFAYGYGWVVAGLLFLLLLGLSIRMFHILSSVRDPFGRLLTIGALTLYSLSFAWSILMSIGLLPLVSVSLPFFSYGFLPVVLHSFLLGMVLSVYRRKNLFTEIKV